MYYCSQVLTKLLHFPILGTNKRALTNPRHSSNLPVGLSLFLKFQSQLNLLWGELFWSAVFEAGVLSGNRLSCLRSLNNHAPFVLGKGRPESVLSGTQAIKNGSRKKSGSHLHPNISSVPYLQPHVHSQFLQLFSLILVYHPILQNWKTCAIMKVQKKSESNVLSNLQI